MADGSSWATALLALTGVVVGSSVSYLSQNQQWTRSSRREVYGAFIVATGSWLEAMGYLATALRLNLPQGQRDEYWVKVNEARAASLSMHAQVQMLGRNATDTPASTMIEVLQDAHSKLYLASEAVGQGRQADIPHMTPIRGGMEQARDDFVVSARKDLGWWHRLARGRRSK